MTTLKSNIESGVLKILLSVFPYVSYYLEN